MYNELLQATKKLNEYNDKSLKHIEKVKAIEEVEEADFFNVVKPFADEVKEVADAWRELALVWIKNEKPKYIHKLQIDTGHENILAVSIQGFYKSTGLKRFKDTVQSNKYLLDNIINKLQ